MHGEIKYANKIEVLVSIFTIDKGLLKVLLFKRNEEPYRGYWMLPTSLLLNDETIEESAEDTITNVLGFQNVYLDQCHIFSDLDRIVDTRIVGVSMIGLVDNITALYGRKQIPGVESEWFAIDSIPKTICDHTAIIDKNVDYLRKALTNTSILKHLFPSDFTLPELQKMYEQILGKELDRRNFRKKFINLGLVEYTGDKNVGFNGRPANLYRFKDGIEERCLF